MGYPMTYPRAIMRNGLTGNYSATGSGSEDWRRIIAGDLRRLELNAQDDLHVTKFAKAAGISKPKARLVIEAFFTDCGTAGEQSWLAAPCWPESRS